MHLQKKIHYLTLTLGPKVKVTLNVAQYPLHQVIYAATKFEVAMSNGLGGYIYKKRDGWRHGRMMDRLWYEIYIPLFSKEKSGYNNTYTI